MPRHALPIGLAAEGLTSSPLGRRAAALSAELHLLLDPLCLLAAAWLAAHLAQWPGGLAGTAGAAAGIAALLSPFVLFDRHAGARAHTMRLALLGALLLALGALTHRLDAPTLAWASVWFAIGLPATLGARWGIDRFARRLQSQGRLTEVVAVVGTGPVADRLVHNLRAGVAPSVEVLGIFDDPGHLLPGRAPDGTVAQLLVLATQRRIDWIVLTLAPADARRMHSLVHRLKALSVPIALCPQHVGQMLPQHTTALVGHAVAVSLLVDPASGPVRSATVPRWIATLMQLAGMLVLAAARPLSRVLRRSPQAAPAPYQFDAHDLDSFGAVATTFGQDRYGFVVTPNADHLIRLHDDNAFRAHYAQAAYVLLDSRFVSHWLRATRALRVPVCTGSDLTARLFERVIAPDDRIVLIGASPTQAQTLRERHGLNRLAHYDPPMGFIRDPKAVEDCLAFIEQHSPFRFCLIAVGSPQQETIAALLGTRGRARGLALCIGASVNFLTGEERRAPVWMQRAGLEWMYRLLQAPRRMAGRYLVRGPRVFAALRGADIVVRPASAHGGSR